MSWNVGLGAGVESGCVSALGHIRSWIINGHVSDSMYFVEAAQNVVAKERRKEGNAPKSWAEVRKCLGVFLGSGGHSLQLFESTPPVSKTTFQYIV